MLYIRRLRKISQTMNFFCIVHGFLHARILEWVAVPFSKESSNPGNHTQVSGIAGDSLPAEPLGKPKNTGVGSLSLLQRIFPTQESNWGLLHCRWILYQLSYYGSPLILFQQEKCKETQVLPKVIHCCSTWLPFGPSVGLLLQNCSKMTFFFFHQPIFGSKYGTATVPYERVHFFPKRLPRVVFQIIASP